MKVQLIRYGVRKCPPTLLLKPNKIHHVVPHGRYGMVGSSEHNNVSEGIFTSPALGPRCIPCIS